MVASHSPEEWEKVLQGEMSSTLGEVGAMSHLVTVALDEAPAELVDGRTMVFQGDSQSAEGAVNSMYSPVEDIQERVLSTHAAVLLRGGRLEYVWQPRETNTRADGNSKLIDRGAWELNWHDTKLVWHTLLGATEFTSPDLDCFADNLNRKCKLFISRWMVPGCLAVDARLQGGLMGGINPATGNKFLCWMNPPFSMWREVARLIRFHRINCLVVYPVWHGAAVSEIESLPIAAGPFTIPDHKHMFRPGPRVPAEDMGRARFSTRAALVWWEK